jgi:hypothetical protein
VPLKFTEFMDGRELHEAVLRKHSRGGTPYEVEVWYDGDGEMYFRVAGPILQKTTTSTKGYHCGTSKFDVKIYDGTQCQKKYEAEVHFH